MTLGGIGGSVLGAAALGHNHAAEARAAFKLGSQQIAANLRLAIRREEDLVVNAGAFVLGSPSASNAEFARWGRRAEVLARYPELLGLAKIVLVPGSKLARYAAQAKADPTGPLGSHGSFAALPPGTRPFYCFIQIAINRNPATAPPAGLDLCAPGDRNGLVERDTGLADVSPGNTGSLKYIAVKTPLYEGGVVPTTVDARRRAFTAWTVMIVSPEVVLRAALQGFPHAAVVLRRGVGGDATPIAFRLGRIPRPAESLTVDLHDGSSVQTFAVRASSGVLASATSTGVLVGGTLLSVLLASLLVVLATGRGRALRLVSERTSQLAFEAMHDSLTRLPNRALVVDRAEQLLARARRQDSPVAALFIDIDGFKHVNDTFGHAAGDALLRVVAARLLSVVRDSDTVGRLGGDEFVVLLGGESLAGEPELVADRLLQVLRQPIEPDQAKASARGISASIGIAVGQRAAAGELLRDADLALYRAKAEGKDRYILFEESMQTVDAERRRLEIDLDDALDNQQVFLVYQPTVDLQTQRVTGVEALIRWRHPTRGVVAPDAFIPLAEKTGMIVPIGRWVLEAACHQAATWWRSGHQIGISVNVSARQLERAEFVAEVRDTLERSGVDPTAVTLEITETILMQHAETAAARLAALKALGVRVAVDDFGTGYSSLAYLRRFPVDALKIDRSLIAGMSSSQESMAVIHTLVQLGKALGLETLGEGIEDKTQLEQLQSEDCDTGQGFLFARPLDAENVEEFFTRHATGAATVHAVR